MSSTIPRMPPQEAAQANRLAGSTSPYLLQHAHNPVDWWPWCEEALARAREQDRPILLSIGYSACHWCHVMAHESFEDAATAELMSRLFVNIKVDREERPDLDRIYQLAHQLLTQRSGGWPLTVFLTPDDHKPFFAGTYFPRKPRHGLPSFAQVLTGVESAYREQRDAIRAQNASLMDALQQLEPASGDAVPDAEPIDRACAQLADSFDAQHGGFGSAPKFPHPTSLELLMRRPEADVGDAGRSPVEMATFTLEHMIRGGLMDQLGGGFCRYSVDAQWMIPHFEKMLYDNGPLLGLCCDAYCATESAVFRDAALATADWVMREMQGPEGGYFSTLDADSEGHEGRFYVWDRDQVKVLLSPAEYAPFAAVYGLDRPPNFEGRWHLHGYRTPEAVAREQGATLEQTQALLASARAALFSERERRVRPGRDDKVLVSWNALMIKGMARAARVLDRADSLESAEASLHFIRKTLWRDGRLLATYRDGRAHLSAYLDDYADLMDALIELLQVRWSSADLSFAIQLAEVLLDDFHDAEHGGFWLTGRSHEPLIHRPKPLTDDSMPAGNGVAAQALQRLGHLIGEPRYLDAAAGTLKLAAASMRHMPYAHAAMLIALDEHIEPVETIVIRAADDRLATWQLELQKGYRPRRLVFGIPSSETALPGTLGAMTAGERPRIYRCRGTSCEPPVDSPAALLQA
ncbi:thioredoxin domain-containing protein [Thiorhodococcus minor]|uniref:Thioredoxin domain-containing protein n=1 Tax=Thiorhodococcus minor TaxID=57489 RepID=A0A6M0JX66_9GAMM|nr:thioredoxin domain-containing protein [Thiorhodococcus minor]NEV61213.1 thioredoxin domain-containing protein [Thiorhodococcus minor]